VPSGRLTGGDQVPYWPHGDVCLPGCGRRGHRRAWRYRVRAESPARSSSDRVVAPRPPTVLSRGRPRGRLGRRLVGILVGRQTAGCYVSSPMRRSWPAVLWSPTSPRSIEFGSATPLERAGMSLELRTSLRAPSLAVDRVEIGTSSFTPWSNVGW